MLEGKPRFGSDLAELREALTGWTVVAHNAPFEKGFLPELLGPIRAPVLDSCELLHYLHPELPSHSLESLLRWAGKGPRSRHRAMTDCEATHAVLLHALEALLRLVGELRHRAQQIAEDHAQYLLRRGNRDIRHAFVLQAEMFFVERIAALGEQAAHEFVEIGRAAFVRVRLVAAREHEQGIEQVAQLVGAALHALEPGHDRRTALARVEQHLDRAADHRERRAQLVAGIGGEGALAAHIAIEFFLVVVEGERECADLVLGETGRELLRAAPRGFEHLDAAGETAHRLDRASSPEPAEPGGQDRAEDHQCDQVACPAALAHAFHAHVEHNV